MNKNISDELQLKIEKLLSDSGCSISRGFFYIRKCIELIATENIVLEMMFLKGLYKHVIEKHNLQINVLAFQKAIERFVCDEWQKFPHLFNQKPCVKKFLITFVHNLR